MLKNIFIVITLGLGLSLGADSVKTVPKASTSKAASKKKMKVDLVEGKKVFETYCVACHGATGMGDGAAAAALNPKPRNFTDTAYMNKRTPEQLRKVISDGGAASGFSVLMAAWKGTLKEPQIDAVLGYVLTFSKKK